MASWSISLGRVFGVQVRMHLFFPILLLLAMFWAASLGHGVGRGVMLWALLVLAVAVRQTARAMLSAGFGLDLQAVLLLPTGGIETFSASAERRERQGVQRWMTLAGPAANTLFGLSAAGLLLSVAPGLDLLRTQWVTPLHLLKAMVWLNLLLAALNLLPVWPLDGGHLPQTQPVAPGSGLRNAKSLPAGGVRLGAGPGIALALLALGITLMNWWLIMAGIGVFLAAQLDGGTATAQEPHGKRLQVREVMLTEYSILSASATLEDAVEQSRHTLQDVFPVVRAGNLVGAAARRDVMNALETQGNGYVQGIMTRTFEIAHPDDVLATALGRASQSGSQLVPVLEGERVVGILTPGNLERAMRLTAFEARRSERRAAAEAENEDERE